MYAHDAGNTGYAPNEEAPTGKIRQTWTYETELRERLPSPTVSEGHIIFSDQKGPVSISAVDGTEEWRVNDVDGTLTAVQDRTVFIGTKSGIKAVTLSKGTEIWTSRTEPTITAVPFPTAVIDDHIFLVSWSGANKGVFSMKTTGEITEWFKRIPTRSIGVAASSESVYLISESGQIYSLSTREGKIRWRTRIAKEESLTVGTPSVREGTIYIALPEPDIIMALSADDGEIKWQTNVDGKPPDTIPSISPPPVDDKQVYVVSKSGITALSRTSGRVAWNYKLDGDGRPNLPSIAGNTIIFGDSSGKIYSLSTVDGSEQWTFDGDGSIGPSPPIVDNRVFVTDDSRGIYVLEG